MSVIPMRPKAGERAHQPMGSDAARVIAITSGKGGVGKTSVTGNLAIALARQGRRVCIFDADTSLANINVILGVTPHYTIEHLLDGERDIDDILLEGPEGIQIIPAASGIAELAELGAAERTRLIAALEHLESRFDYLLIDTAAGIGDSVLSFIQSAQHTILVISTEPTSLTDAFALLRVLRRRGHDRPAYVLVNMALNYANSMEVYKRFEAAVRKYLSMKVHYLGYITDDKAIKAAVIRQQPVLVSEPDALASRCFTTLAAVLGKQFSGPVDPHRFSAWWNAIAPGTPDPMPAPAAPSASDAAAPADLPPAAEAAGETGATEDLEALSARARALLARPDVDAAAFERFCEPLLELFVARFGRRPSGDGGGDEGERTTARARQEALLTEYQAIVERLQAEQTALHRALTRLYDIIETGLGPAATPDAGLEGRGPDGGSGATGAEPERGPGTAGTEESQSGVSD